MNANWPELSFSEAKETYETIHLWTQIVGKIKLSKFPWINHSWHVTLFVTPTGLSTADIQDVNKHFEINFNFLEHTLTIETSNAQKKSFGLENLSVAGFYEKLLNELSSLGIEAKINTVPCELVDPIPFPEDTQHKTYDPQQAKKLHQAFMQSNQVFTRFRSEFIGKSSPVHYFWGSCDLAVSRFSGKTAPEHPGGIPNLPDWVAREAYSHEVCSCGFWPGNEAVPFAAYYSYIYPEPAGYREANIKPAEAYFHPDMQEFILPYEVVQQSDNPEQTLLDFLHSTYEAAANLAHWDRKALEKQADFEKTA